MYHFGELTEIYNRFKYINFNSSIKFNTCTKHVMILKVLQHTNLRKKSKLEKSAITFAQDGTRSIDGSTLLNMFNG